MRHFKPASAVENGVLSAPLRGMAAELLEEESNAGSGALITQIAEPIHGRRATAALTLATGDQPVDAVQIEVCEWRQ